MTRLVSRSAPAWVLLAYASTAAARDNEIPDAVRMPLVVVNSGRAVTPGEVDAVADGLGVPLDRGSHLMTRMGLLNPPKPEDAVRMKELFDAAEDQFFNGKHREAAAKFREIVSWADAHPERLLIGSKVRDIVFKSHIVLAVIAAGDEALVEQHFRAAAAFEDLDPTRADFPPWVCEQFHSIKHQIRLSKERTAKIAQPMGCELHLAGKTVGAVTAGESLFPGETVVQAQCKGRSSLIQRIELLPGETAFSPIFLSDTSLVEDEADLRLSAAPGVDPADLTVDLLALLKATSRDRLVAIVGTRGELEVWLLDRRAGRVLRSAAVKSDDVASARRAGVSVATGPETALLPESVAAVRPWYRDPLAWSFVGIGAAALGVGAALYGVYGKDNREEVIALTAMAGGGGLMGTGIVLFFFPMEEKAETAKSAKRIPVLGVRGTF